MQKLFILSLALTVFVSSQAWAEVDQRSVLVPNHVSGGITSYFRLHGQWPENWRAVVNDGIHQSWLLAVNGRDVDPDDGVLDFVGDVSYTVRTDGKAQIDVLLEESEAPVGWIVDRPATYEADFTQWESLSNLESRGITYVPFLANEKLMRQFAIVGAMNYGVRLFYLQHRRVPRDIDEFIVSGFSPINRSSINPVTGSTFLFDGSPNDLSFEPNADLTGCSIHPVLSDGSVVGGINIF
jgi:hypothetical protein